MEVAQQLDAAVGDVVHLALLPTTLAETILDWIQTQVLRRRKNQPFQALGRGALEVPRWALEAKVSGGEKLVLGRQKANLDREKISLQRVRDRNVDSPVLPLDHHVLGLETSPTLDE